MISLPLNSVKQPLSISIHVRLIHQEISMKKVAFIALAACFIASSAQAECKKTDEVIALAQQVGSVKTISGPLVKAIVAEYNRHVLNGAATADNVILLHYYEGGQVFIGLNKDGNVCNYATAPAIEFDAFLIKMASELI